MYTRSEILSDADNDILEALSLLFGVDTLQEIIEKCGYKKSTANTISSRKKLSEKQRKEFKEILRMNINEITQKRLDQNRKLKESTEELLKIVVGKDTCNTSPTGSMFAADGGDVYSNSVSMNIYYDLYFSAGGGNPFALVDPQKISLDKKFLQNFYSISNFEKTDIVRVSGNSMYPTINDGDFMFVERGTEPNNGDMVIARLENELYVKRFHKEPFGGDIRLISDNTEYKPIVLDTDEKKEQLEIYGIVKSRVVLY